MLRLLHPARDGHFITIEGFDRPEQDDFSIEANHISDLVRYSDGSDPDRTVVQYKHAAAVDAPHITFSSVEATLKKFAAAERDAVSNGKTGRLSFEFRTNQAISPDLEAGRIAVAKGEAGSNEAEKLRALLTESGVDPASFAARLTLKGDEGDVCGVSRDAAADLRGLGSRAPKGALNDLLQLALSRARAPQESSNRIDRDDVLNALGYEHEDLYPSPDSFPSVERLVERPLLSELVQKVESADRPVLVHGAGGCGKTVLMLALADRLKARFKVVRFDGFSGGSWRDPSKSRHRAERTLVHFANLLAADGYCELLLAQDRADGALRRFRKRLIDAVDTVRVQDGKDGIVLVLDAADHVAMSAEEQKECGFVPMLLASLAAAPVEGVKVVLSCRTERIEQTIGAEPVARLEVRPFDKDEAFSVVAKWDPDASTVDRQALFRRSGGNPRVLDALLRKGKPWDRESGGVPVQLDDLIRNDLSDAQDKLTRLQGPGSAEATGKLLAALAVLPAPASIEEVAACAGLLPSAVESFVADIAPLIEIDHGGLVFRDEPTQTLVAKDYPLSSDAAAQICERLNQRQGVSRHAARALPFLLLAADRTDDAIALANSPTFPAGISELERKRIKAARLHSAVRLAARGERIDDLLELSLDAARLTGGADRAEEFLLGNGDLAGLVADPELTEIIRGDRLQPRFFRSAVLAMLHMVQGQREDALRYSAQALGAWHAMMARDPADRQGITALDEVGFVLPQLLWGRRTDALRSLGNTPLNHRVAFCREALNILERSAAVELTGLRPLLRHALRLFPKAPSVLTAVATTPSADPDVREHALRRLAAAPAVRPTNPAALVEAALCAWDLDHRTAFAILSRDPLRPNDRVVLWRRWTNEPDTALSVIRAGMVAASEARNPNLVDLLPLDWAKRLEDEKDLDADDFRGIVSALFPKDPNRPHSHNRSDGEEALQAWIVPLRAHAGFVTRLLCAAPEDRHAILDGWLDHFKKDLETRSWSRSPAERDSKANVMGMTLARVGAGLKLFDEPLTNRLFGMLEQGNRLDRDSLLEIAEMIARTRRGEMAVLAFANRMSERLAKEEDVATALELRGKLARTVWWYSSAEAASRVGELLSQSDRHSVNNGGIVRLTLGTAAKLLAPGLSSTVSHDLARLAEFELEDEEKFDWGGWVEGLSRAAGTGALAIASRLADRDKARLEFNLVGLLTRLVSAGALPSDLAAGLFGLDVTGVWDRAAPGGLDTLAAVVTPHLQASQQAAFFKTLCLEIDRMCGLSPEGRAICALADLARKHLSQADPLRTRLEELARRNTEPEAAPQHREAIDRAILDQLMQGGVQTILEHLNKANSWSDRISKPHLLLALADRASGVDAKVMLLEALVATSGMWLSNKHDSFERLLGGAVPIKVLDRHKQAWGLALVRLHVDELVSEEWGSARDWRTLVELFGLTRFEIAQEVIKTLGQGGLAALEGSDWMVLAREVASEASQDTLCGALTTHCTNLASTLPPESGDGPWQDRFAPPDDPVEIAAGLIWARLGDPEASARWRAAHAVSRMAQLGRFDVVEALIVKFDHGEAGADAGAFGSPRHSFFVHDARLWLLFALGRICRADFPQMAKHFDFFQAIAKDTAFPHVAMREAARSAALALIRGQETFKERLVATNRSALPPVVERMTRDNEYAEAPKDAADGNQSFNFDHDFRKETLSNLISAFDLEGPEIVQRAAAWARHVLPDATGTWFDERAPGVRRDDGLHGDRSWRPVSRAGYYAAWHGVQLAAGELLTQHPVVEWDQPGDAWQYLLDIGQPSAGSGIWHPEATDLTPIDVAKEVPARVGKRKALQDDKDRKELGGLIGLDSIDPIVINGRWSQADGTRVAVTSLLAAPRVASRAVQAALSMETSWLVGLPSYCDAYHEDGQHIKFWIHEPHQPDRMLDRYDPFVAGGALHRAQPIDEIIKAFGLDDPDGFGRVWRYDNAQAFISQVWRTAIPGPYQVDYDNNRRLAVTRQFLNRLLRKTGLTLAVVVAARSEADTASAEGKDRQAVRRFGFVMDPKEKVHAPKRLSRPLRAALESLKARGRDDFEDCYRELRKA